MTSPAPCLGLVPPRERSAVAPMPWWLRKPVRCPFVVLEGIQRGDICLIHFLSQLLKTLKNAIHQQHESELCAFSFVFLRDSQRCIQLSTTEGQLTLAFSSCVRLPGCYPLIWSADPGPSCVSGEKIYPVARARVILTRSGAA